MAGGDSCKSVILQVFSEDYNNTRSFSESLTVYPDSAVALLLSLRKEDLLIDLGGGHGRWLLEYQLAKNRGDSLLPSFDQRAKGLMISADQVKSAAELKSAESLAKQATGELRSFYEEAKLPQYTEIRRYFSEISDNEIREHLPVVGNGRVVFHDFFGVLSYTKNLGDDLRRVVNLMRRGDYLLWRLDVGSFDIEGGKNSRLNPDVVAYFKASQGVKVIDLHEDAAGLGSTISLLIKKTDDKAVLPDLENVSYSSHFPPDRKFRYKAKRGS